MPNRRYDFEFTAVLGEMAGGDPNFVVFTMPTQTRFIPDEYSVNDSDLWKYVAVSVTLLPLCRPSFRCFISLLLLNYLEPCPTDITLPERCIQAVWSRRTMKWTS